MNGEFCGSSPGLEAGGAGLGSGVQGNQAPKALSGSFEGSFKRVPKATIRDLYGFRVSGYVR